MIYIVAPTGEQFQGYDLLQALLAAGFRFGEMSIFHRYEKATGEGKKLFSLASASEPGIFDIHQMGAFSCKGLCLFMQLSGEEHNQDAFNLMLQAAALLSDDLNATLLGSDRKPLNDETLALYRRWLEQHQENFAEITA